METDVSKLTGWKKIKNQQIAHVLITPTFKCAMLCYSVILIVLVLFGAISLMKAGENNDALFRYDDKCTSNPCTLNLEIDVDLVDPKIYYRIDNFYSNHRNFVKSRSYKQLRGEVLGTGDLADCDPVIKMKDLDSQTVLSGATLGENKPANPCGLIAKYMFNDRYDLSSLGITVSEKGIAHDVDKESKFKHADTSKGYEEVQYRDVEDEHLMVWFQMETFPSFIKLWAHGKGTLKKGTYQIEIENNFDVEEFNAKKYIYLSEVNDFGGANSFMGIAFLVVAALVAAIMIGFVVLYMTRLRGKDVYNTENMEW